MARKEYPGRIHFSVEEQEKIIESHEEGWDTNFIAREHSCSEEQIIYFLKHEQRARRYGKYVIREEDGELWWSGYAKEPDGVVTRFSGRVSIFAGEVNQTGQLLDTLDLWPWVDCDRDGMTDHERETWFNSLPQREDTDELITHFLEAGEGQEFGILNEGDAEATHQSARTITTLRALIGLLVDNGVTTDEEIEKYRAEIEGEERCEDTPS